MVPLPFEHKLWMWGGPALGAFLLVEAIVGNLPLKRKRVAHAIVQSLWLGISLVLGSTL